MFCPKCGNKVEQNTKFCPKCGNLLNNEEKTIFTPNIANSNKENINTNNENFSEQNININNRQNQVTNSNNNYGYQNRLINNNYPQNNAYYMPKKNKSGGVAIIIGVLLIIAIIVLIFVLSSGGSDDYYFPTNNNNPVDPVSNPTSNTTGKYKTIIITDNYYYGVSIKSPSAAKELIVKDSTSQKSKCPADIKKIEDEIIMNYGITAVNLCEMDLGFAKELFNVIKKVYNDFPNIRGHLTNLTLNNVPMSQGYIAAFQPLFKFAMGELDTDPLVMKTQIFLNTTYYLNKERFKVSVDASTKAGYFPKNANIYSPVAHELGHYISFLALMKHYHVDSVLLIDDNNIDIVEAAYNDFGTGDFSLSMIKEAYNNYVRDTGKDIGFDAWRGTISQYALAKNNNGEYIYDETIAESFHDVYLNGDNAVDASKYVYAVLKSKL